MDLRGKVMGLEKIYKKNLVFIVQLAEGYRSRKSRGLYTLEHDPVLGVDQHPRQYTSTWVILMLAGRPSHTHRSQTSI